MSPMLAKAPFLGRCLWDDDNALKIDGDDGDAGMERLMKIAQTEILDPK